MDLTVPGPPSTLGRGILFRLGEKAQELGIQRVIYTHTQYDAASPSGKPYHGLDPHLTHLHIEQTKEAAETLSVALAIDLLDGYDATGDEPMVILGKATPPGDTARWLLSGGKRIYLSNWTNVQHLIDAGFPTILLGDSVLAQIPEVR